MSQRQTALAKGEGSSLNRPSSGTELSSSQPEDTSSKLQRLIQKIKQRGDATWEKVLAAPTCMCVSSAAAHAPATDAVMCTCRTSCLMLSTGCGNCWGQHWEWSGACGRSLGLVVLLRECPGQLCKIGQHGQSSSDCKDIKVQ